MRRFFAVVVLSTCVIAAGCAAKKELSADEYFKDAEGYFRDGAYSMAVEDFRTLLEQHPFSQYTEEAELRIAHAYYLEAKYIEAVAALTDFQRRHPTSPHLPFVGYELGMCYKRQMGTIDRDQSSARNAATYFETLIQQYPNSPYAELARQELADCRKSLAEHEMYVARFYSQRGNSRAAEQRALEVVGRYPATDTAAEALYDLSQIYRKEDDRQRAALALAALVKEHPSSSRAKVAKKALARLGEAEGQLAAEPRQTLLAASGYTPTTWAPPQPLPVVASGAPTSPRLPTGIAAGSPAANGTDPFYRSPGAY